MINLNSGDSRQLIQYSQQTNKQTKAGVELADTIVLCRDFNVSRCWPFHSCNLCLEVLVLHSCCMAAEKSRVAAELREKGNKCDLICGTEKVLKQDHCF